MIMMGNRNRLVEFRLPGVEQILDFVRQVAVKTTNNGQQIWTDVMIPPVGYNEDKPARCNFICIVPLPQEINREFKIE